MPSFKNLSYDDALNVANCSELLQNAVDLFKQSHPEEEVETEVLVSFVTVNFKTNEDRDAFIECMKAAKLIDDCFKKWGYEWDDIAGSKHFSVWSICFDKFSIDLCVEAALETGEKSVVKPDMSLLVKSFFSGFRKVTDKYGIPIDASYKMFLEMFDKGMFNSNYGGEE